MAKTFVCYNAYYSLFLSLILFNTTAIAQDQTEKSTSNPHEKSSVHQLTGLYRMVRPKQINVNSSGYERGFYVEHIAFLSGGKLFWRLPPEGLLDFDLAAACVAYPNDCGTYEIRGDEIHVLRGPEKKKYIIHRDGERLINPPSLGKGSFRPVSACNGLQLEGNYRRNASEPTISFTKDGTFRDGGVFRFFGTIRRLDGSTYQDDGRGGSGTYTLEQNTLVLKYPDGQIKRFVFEAFSENPDKKTRLTSFLSTAKDLSCIE